MDYPPIFIPSRSRATQQRTLAQFDKSLHKRIWLVIPPQQYKDYRRANPNAQIAVCKKKGIGRVRQWLCEKLFPEEQRIIMLDDDMYFYHRAKPRDYHLENNTHKDNFAMLDMMMELMDKGYHHVGIGARPEASHHLCRYRTCTRINNCHLIDLKSMCKVGARFDRISVMEDFDFILTMLEAGKRNAVTLDYVWNQSGSNTAGGCSDYRSAKVQTRAAHALARLHPSVVKVVEKEVRGATSWDGMKTRTDVRIQWRKAFTGKPMKRWAMEHESRRRA